jgi:hypothetical protein
MTTEKTFSADVQTQLAAPTAAHSEAKNSSKTTKEDCAVKPPPKGLEHLMDAEQLLIEQKIEAKKGEQYSL